MFQMMQQDECAAHRVRSSRLRVRARFLLPLSILGLRTLRFRFTRRQCFEVILEIALRHAALEQIPILLLQNSELRMSSLAEWHPLSFQLIRTIQLDSTGPSSRRAADSRRVRVLAAISGELSQLRGALTKGGGGPTLWQADCFEPYIRKDEERGNEE